MIRDAALLRVTIVYVVAMVAGTAWLLWGPGTEYLWLGGLIADLVATLVVFPGSRIFRNSSVYDPYWSVFAPLLAFYRWVPIRAGSPGGMRQPQRRSIHQPMIRSFTSAVEPSPQRG